MALIYADGEGPEVQPQRVVTVEGGKKPHSHKRRDVDVLSNRCKGLVRRLLLKQKWIASKCPR